LVPHYAFNDIATNTQQENYKEHQVVEDDDFALLYEVDITTQPQVTDFPVSSPNTTFPLENKHAWLLARICSCCIIRHFNAEKRDSFKNQCLIKIGINPEPLFLFVSAIYQMDLTQVLLPII
jgi:hypothetical protein